MRMHVINTFKSNWSFSAALFAVSFGLNWIWETAQMFAYAVKPAERWMHILRYCTLATVIDALVTIAIYSLLLRVLKPPFLSAAKQWKFYLAAAFLGAACAVFFEWFAFRFGLWSYGEQMPVLPVIGTGLLPFVQLTLLVPLAIWLSLRLIQGRGKNAN